MTFKARVLAIVSKIPRGKILTYKDVARKAGNSRASRAVGAILGANHDPRIPCHRVVRTDGALGGYNKGIEKKKALLKKEGAF